MIFIALEMTFAIFANNTQSSRDLEQKNDPVLGFVSHFPAT